MSNRKDTTDLFLGQIGSHTEELATLIAVGPTQPIEPALAEKALRCTRMLVNSAGVLKLDELCVFLQEYEGLLGAYFEKQLPWDERIAQLTSELIELEDQWVTDGSGKTTTTIADVFSVEQLAALTQEAVDVKIVSETLEPPQPQQPVTPESPDAEIADPVVPRDEPMVVEIDRASLEGVPAAPKPSQEPVRFAGSAGELQRHTSAFLDQWATIDWGGTDVDGGTLQQMRKELFSIGFHALSIEQLIGYRMSNDLNSQIDSLAPVSLALQDFAQLLVAGTDRSIEVTLIGEDNRIDVRLLMPAVKILQGMIADTATKCADTDLRIDVVVQEQHGSLIWSFRDNGKNHLMEQGVDPVEYFNYYPSLRDTSGTLADLHSLLWVEPDEKHDTRFAFTLPVTPEGGGFVTWQHGETSFAVLSNQISDVVASDEVAVGSDAQGEYLVHDGYRIPLIRLENICDGVEIDGKQMVILGHVDMRVAFYVDHAGEVVEGTWLRTAVSAWKGLRNGVAEFDGQRTTVIEASDLMAHCLGRGVPSASEASTSETGTEASPLPAATSDDPAANGHVLVVERSEALRNELSAILAERSLEMRAVDQIDEAIEILCNDSPVLIISEFRVPSMAAKVLVEKLRTEGKDIPVLVTTTHSGKTAESLVEKLGAAGYIGKPLDAADVLTRVSAVICGEEAAATEA